MSHTTKDGVELVEGREYVITRQEGADLSGMTPRVGYLQGWGQHLPLGSVVRYEGYRRGWGSDPIYEHMFSSEESREVHASFVNLRPQEGLWDTRPIAGLIGPVETTVLTLDETGLHAPEVTE